MNICPAMCNEKLFKTILFEQIVINFYYYEKTYEIPNVLLDIWNKDKVLFEILEQLPSIYTDDLIDGVPTKIWNTEHFKTICEDVFNTYRVEYIANADKRFLNAFIPSELADWLCEWSETDNRFKLHIDSFEKRKNVIERYYLNSIIKKPSDLKIYKI